MTPASSHLDDQDRSDVIDGQADAAVLEHLSGCGQCQAALRRWRQSIAQIAVAPTPPSNETVEQAVAAARAAWSEAASPPAGGGRSRAIAGRRRRSAVLRRLPAPAWTSVAAAVVVAGIVAGIIALHGSHSSPTASPRSAASGGATAGPAAPPRAAGSSGAVGQPATPAAGQSSTTVAGSSGPQGEASGSNSASGPSSASATNGSSASNSASESSPTEPSAAAQPPGLGAVAGPAALRAVLSGLSSGAPQAPTSLIPAEAGCATQAGTVARSHGVTDDQVDLVRSLDYRGTPATVYSYTEGAGHLAVVVDAKSCATLATVRF